MTRARDDKRRNNRQAFALYHPDGLLVGEAFLVEADGCETRFFEGVEMGRTVSPTHEPGSHVLSRSAL